MTAPEVSIRKANALVDGTSGDVDGRGRLEPGLLADIVGVPDAPLTDITATERVASVMKGGKVYRS